MSSLETNKDQDYRTSIVVNKTPAEVYEAIKNVKGWWIGTVQGDANEEGSEFNYRYKHYHNTTQKVTELTPNKRIVWRVTEADIESPIRDEWKGTHIIFEILPKGTETEVKFTHQGLTPKFVCYKDCSGGWDFFISKSLKNFIDNGQGIDPGF